MGYLSGTPVAAPDDYQTLAVLLGVQGPQLRLIEGFIQAATSGLTLRFGDSNTPATTEGGLALSAGAALGIGPVRSSASAWPLDAIWVRETSAGGGATVSVVGVTDG